LNKTDGLFNNLRISENFPVPKAGCFDQPGPGPRPCDGDAMLDGNVMVLTIMKEQGGYIQPWQDLISR